MNTASSASTPSWESTRSSCAWASALPVSTRQTYSPARTRIASPLPTVAASSSTSPRAAPKASRQAAAAATRRASFFFMPQTSTQRPLALDCESFSISSWSRAPSAMVFSAGQPWATASRKVK